MPAAFSSCERSGGAGLLERVRLSFGSRGRDAAARRVAMSSVRYPAVAGAFYPADGARLRETVQALLPAEAEPRPAVGVVVPHAGYIYSGGCAGRTLAGVRIPDQVILLGPNHTGRGGSLAAPEEEQWATPLGSVRVDRDLLEALAREAPALEFDSRAHTAEHCLEVEVPFLQVLGGEALSIAPIVVGIHDLHALTAFGEAIARVVGEQETPPLVLVSSDMTHYEPAFQAKEKDEKALAALEAVDADRLYRTVMEEKITMCGVAPAVAACTAWRRLGVRRGKLACYTHSGIVTGDEREVVAYAGMIFIS